MDVMGLVVIHYQKGDDYIMINFAQVLGLLGFVVRAIGFLLIGFALARFFLDAYNKANWQVQIALALGFFAVLVGLTNYASPGSAGMYALGAGGALMMNMIPKKEKDEDK
jgi:hypothetical protein